MFVRQLSGGTIALSIEKTSTIDLLQHDLYIRTQITKGNQCVLHRGRQLQAATAMSEAIIRAGATLSLVARL